MDIAGIIDTFGSGIVAASGGLLVGLAFGAFAQRSQFCMRSAVIEVSRGVFGKKLAIWLLAFSGAVALTQWLIAGDLLDVTQARQLAARGSMSGAVIGGLMFGAGMIFSRGCAARLLVLSATGNLRALLAGLVLTIIAQASLRGVLSPFREGLAELWTVDGGRSRDLMAVLGFNGGYIPILIATVLLIAALILARRSRLSLWVGVGAFGVGAMVAVGWLFTYVMSYQSFDPILVKSISFIGPSTDTLMALINEPSIPLTFDLGMVPGVFAGSFLAAVLTRDLKFACFNSERPMPRYIFGASLMGFGGMLAGGCAVGAGVTGGAVFALTAWVALLSMWVGAALTDLIVDRLRLRPGAVGSTKGMAPAE
ncbi:YeeE/YedE family protein [Varunaivibrio sulfuroxidans]|uniref:Sulfur transporter n=1 Tax=Varunaivibrio sulfuroxidans TaxID=1773489 RepID=A0A4V2UNX1_9PROT|nr:YeeE/YedE family protein [Varunaivibrio sulfuroxidans]TCS63681.1 sulfur transporter [Varunaivibrio sulfuroxidans]WES30184.1 YeeE/YedE family protein [Varunaivibrio sulfuroxidans]